MKTRTLILAAMLQTALLLTAGAASLNAGQQPGSNSVNVTTIVYDYDPTNPNNVFLTRSDDYPGNLGYAKYSAALDPKVTSTIAWNSFWSIYLTGQTVRTFWLTLASQGVPLPDGYYSANTEIFSSCYDQFNNSLSWTAMKLSDSYNRCRLGVIFSPNGTSTQYKLLMSPVTPVTGSGWARVTCTGATHGRSNCNKWRIVPNTTDGPNPTVAHFYKCTQPDCTVASSFVYLGSYHNTYRIDVTIP